MDITSVRWWLKRWCSSIHFLYSTPWIKGSVNLTRTNRLCLQRLRKHHRVSLPDWMRGRHTLFGHGYQWRHSECTDLLGEVFHANSCLNISPQFSGYRYPKWPEWSPPAMCCCFCSTILTRGKTDMSVINISIQGDALSLTGCTLCLYLGCGPLSRDFPPKWLGVFRQFHSEQPVQVVAMTFVWCKQYVRNYFPAVGFCSPWHLPHRFLSPSSCYFLLCTLHYEIVLRMLLKKNQCHYNYIYH